jgi:hypothetical protein
MRIASAGHAVFAALMIGLGTQGLLTGEFTTVWQPVPKGVPAREVLAYLCALLSLASGIGLLWRRTAGLAARVLLGSLVFWLLVWRVRAVFLASLLEGSWSFADTMVMAAGTWVLFAWFATDERRKDRMTRACDAHRPILPWCSSSSDDSQPLYEMPA